MINNNEIRLINLKELIDRSNNKFEHLESNKRNNVIKTVIPLKIRI